MALRTCKECGKEVSSKAKKCPNCGVDQRNFFMRHKIISFVGIIFVLIIMSAVFGEDDNSSLQTVGNANQSQTKKDEFIAKVGETTKSDKFEITIISINEKKQVGTQYFNSKPSEGGTYIVVNWSYKNISDSPVKAFDFPSIRLEDNNKTRYESDIGASANYATEIKLDRKILSDLNPGILVKDAQVFEISKESYSKGEWRVAVNADKSFYVQIK